MKLQRIYPLEIQRAFSLLVHCLRLSKTKSLFVAVLFTFPNREQLHLVKSTVYLTGKPAPEVKRALSKLLNPAEDSVHGGILGNNGMMRTSRTVDDSIHRLELCSKSLHRPRSVLEISRSSLLHLTPSQSHHRPSSVSATLKVCVYACACACVTHMSRQSSESGISSLCERKRAIQQSYYRGNIRRLVVRCLQYPGRLGISSEGALKFSLIWSFRA